MKFKDELRDVFENELFDFTPTEGLFNQYKDIDERVDLLDAHEIRKQNLLNYLESFTKKPNFLVVGEAPGPWGCRFSGVPFTGERQLCQHTLPFSGDRSGREKPLLKVKYKQPYTSQSAETFWKIMKPYHPKFFVWDCVPFHPHDLDNILSVRTPTAEERRSCYGLLRKITEIIKPKDILAIGRKAEKAFNQIDIESFYVRHPSYGGANKFESGVEEFFKVNLMKR